MTIVLVTKPPTAWAVAWVDPPSEIGRSPANVTALLGEIAIAQALHGRHLLIALSMIDENVTACHHLGATLIKIPRIETGLGPTEALQTRLLRCGSQLKVQGLETIAPTEVVWRATETD
jgi:hypothetical protein